MSEYRLKLTGGPEPVTIHKYNTFEEAAAKFNATKELYPKGLLNIETDINGKTVSINPDFLTYTLIPADKDLKILNPELLSMTKEKAEYKKEFKKEVGKKYDSSKPMAGSVIRVFPQAIMGIGAVIREGAKKYPNPNNWKLNDNIEARYFDSLIRHMCKHFSGQVKDEETGLLHLIHAAWNSLAILEKYLIDHPDVAKEIMYPDEVRDK